MSKIDIIDYCGDCSLRYYKNNDLHCETTDDKVSENLPCPPNCPLPNLLEATRIERERCLAAVESVRVRYKECYASNSIDEICDMIKAKIKAEK